MKYVHVTLLSSNVFHTRRAYSSKCPMVFWCTPKVSCNKYSSDIESSGFAFCRTQSFNVFMYLSMKNIHIYGIGPAILTSSTKWIIKCYWPSKNDVGNCICNNVMTTWNSSLMTSISLVFMFFVDIHRINLDNLKMAFRTDRIVRPRIAIGMWKRNIL